MPGGDEGSHPALSVFAAVVCSALLLQWWLVRRREGAATYGPNAATDRAADPTLRTHKIFGAATLKSIAPRRGELFVLDKRPPPALDNKVRPVLLFVIRMTRAAIINLLASPYIQMAMLTGASKREVIVKHALPNAWAPIATVIAFNLAYLVVGVVVVEVVFVYPGIGQLMVDSVTSRNIPVVQACALIFAVTYISLNLIADIIGIVTNPRLLHPK